MRWIVSGVAAVVLSACGMEGSPMMKPGEDCLECHGGGGGGGEEDDEGRPWTFAGTVFETSTSPTSAGVRGVRIHATDATGRTVTVTSNEAGNFYLADKLAFPLHVSLERNGVLVPMDQPVSYGGCNRCHDQPPRQGAQGRLVAP